MSTTVWVIIDTVDQDIQFHGVAATADLAKQHCTTIVQECANVTGETAKNEPLEWEWQHPYQGHGGIWLCNNYDFAISEHPLIEGTECDRRGYHNNCPREGGWANHEPAQGHGWT